MKMSRRPYRTIAKIGGTTPPRWTVYARRSFVAALAVYGLVNLTRPGRHRLLDSVDLAIHETGHLVFQPFGEFVGSLGGTLMQLIMPAAFVLYFLRRGDHYAAAIALWWVAQNCWNISVYVRDARSQLLPLVGGGVHDWTFILGQMGLLAHDQVIGGIVHLIGVLIFGFSVVWAFRVSRLTSAPT